MVFGDLEKLPRLLGREGVNLSRDVSRRLDQRDDILYDKPPLTRLVQRAPTRAAVERLVAPLAVLPRRGFAPRAAAAYRATTLTSAAVRENLIMVSLRRKSAGPERTAERGYVAMMTPEARRILEVFLARGLRVGDKIHPAHFGDAIVWEEGFVRDEPVQRALSMLREQGYLLEHRAAFELTEKGDRFLYGEVPSERGG